MTCRAMRVILLMNLLQEEAHSVEYLAEHFGISVRSVQYDLADIQRPPLNFQLERRTLYGSPNSLGLSDSLSSEENLSDKNQDSGAVEISNMCRECIFVHDHTRDIAIYALLDPRDGVVRYIGQSVDPDSRYDQHLDLKTESNVSKRAWIAELSKAGFVPQMIVLQTVVVDDADSVETLWIKLGQSLGWPLLNVAIPDLSIADALRAVDSAIQIH